MNLRQLARRVATLEALVIGIPPTLQDISQSELDYELERSARDWQDIRDADRIRTKARYWDAVASGKVQLRNCTEGYWAWFGDGKDASKVTDTYSTAAEAVQAAIEAGALGPPTSDAGALK